MLRVACAPLADAAGEAGYVVVFDDITSLLHAQRDAAWGEVARRLAHEIRNPLTPIQLAAERLGRRLSGKLEGEDAEILDRATRTIVQQVESMKAMVNAFSEYARAPELKLARVDLNDLVAEVVELYRAQESGAALSMLWGGREALQAFGWSFFTTSTWDVGAGQFGALVAIFRIAWKWPSAPVRHDDANQQA